MLELSASAVAVARQSRRTTMLTRLFPVLAAAAVFAASSTSLSTHFARPPRVSTDSLEETLASIERQSWVAWQHHDGNFFQNFLSDDHVEVGTTGIATKAQVVAYVASPACVVIHYAVDHFHVTRFDDNTALLTYRAEQNTTCGNAPVPSPTWVSSLFVRRSGKWMNALYQHTKVE
jgi:hypothetical protein